MEALKAIIPLVFAASLALLVLRVGLDSRLVDLTHVLRRPALLLKAILAVNVLVPLAAILLLALIPISRVAAGGVLLMAISPVPPLVPGKELGVGGDRTYAYSVYVTLILLAIVVVPLWVLGLDAIYGEHLVLPPLAVARNVLLGVILPLGVGLAVRRAAPGFATAAAPIVSKLAMIALLLAFVPLLIASWPAFAALLGDGTALVMALMAVAALVGGHLLGGPDPADRAALAVTAATRHPGIAMMIAAENTTAPVSAAILGAMMVSMAIAIPYQQWAKRRVAHARTA